MQSHLSLPGYPAGTDWSQPAQDLAAELGVSISKAHSLKRQVMGDKWNADRIKKMNYIIANSDAPASELAAVLDVSVWTINNYRRKLSRKRRVGPSRKTAADFPTDTDWSLSTNKLAKQLGCAWVTVRKIKIDLLKDVKIDHQTFLDIGSLQTIPSDYTNVDWRQSATVLSAQLNLDIEEVRRLKSEARKAK